MIVLYEVENLMHVTKMRQLIRLNAHGLLNEYTHKYIKRAAIISLKNQQQ